MSAPDSNLESLPQLWAKKYVQNLVDPEGIWQNQASMSREAIAEQLNEFLRNASARAWTQTENILGNEIKRHSIDSQLINPWQISQDVRDVYEKALLAYRDRVLPRRFSVKVSHDLGVIRQRHTANDPRVIGFVSMQFHYTGQVLLEPLKTEEKSILSEYFKVIDDHLYMPLQRAYYAAAELNYDDPILQAVRSLLPLITNIAQKIYQDVTELYPGYQCYTGKLTDAPVRISSIRDAEMFQVYLCLCALEQNFSSVKQELFPLCAMLYPSLKVRWELVQQLINLLGIEIQRNLGPDLIKIFKPYLKSFAEMFSPEVFSDS
ncbi:hypothetical protein [Oscillatoria sp. FACHB-1406]|uniref:hypothetical protein n=1 Tax=Oscillatoria sp. FACHB-1406 TaxID=2692846 RepID=UPI001688AC9C|nr:hypothetical protein [Oscillatoria sp. FACHB-1406]